MLRKMKYNGHLFCSCDMFLHYCSFSPFYLFFNINMFKTFLKPDAVRNVWLSFEN